MRHVIVLAVTLAGLAAGVPPAAAGDDPLDTLWRQQAERPSHSITAPDTSGQLHTIEYVHIDGHAVTEGDIVIGTAVDAAAGKIQLPGIFPDVTDDFTGAANEPPPMLSRNPPRMRGGRRAVRPGGCRSRDAGAATTQAGALWPEGRVPYVLSPALSAEAREAIAQAMKDYHDNTCVRFVPRTNEPGFLSLVPGNGCYSYVGRVAPAEQEVSIGRGCERKGIVIHELMHALGFYHEHSRSDRDSAVTVHLENVMKGYEGQFQKLTPPQNRLYGAFDYGSVMLYGRNFFSSNGQDTLVPTAPAQIGQRIGFSPADLAAVRTLYGCPAPQYSSLSSLL
ncbi:M12 family metallopeptidase [Sphaerisporangium fuscum]|uniref:M12 family metallopeptidase n=1 Tax=Sphaerisporangium fuscum TaxID=2835868 RepID=UPI001BDBFCE8|nr:M12 family metallopeptidase [Sphaerisporangium fuscum]